MNEKEWIAWRNKISIAQKKRWEIKKGKSEIKDLFKILLMLRKEEDAILTRIYELEKKKFINKECVK